MWSKYFDVVMINSYFDLESFDDPVKPYLTQEYTWTLDGDYYQDTNIFLKENYIEAADDFFSFKPPEREKFYTVTKTTMDRYASGSNYYGYFYFNLDPETQMFKRSVLTILDLLAQVGGIFSIMQTTFTLLIGLYAERMIYFTVLSK